MLRHARWLLALLSALVGGACFEDSPQSPGSGDGSTAGDSADGSGTAPDTTRGSADAGVDVDSTTASDDTPITSTADATDDGVTSGDGGSACLPGSTCAAAPPAGWNGPFVVPMIAGADPAPCPAEYPDLVSSVHADLSAPPLGCACACTPPTTACSASVGLYLDGACATLDIAHQAAAGGCVQTTGATAVLATASADPTPAACDPDVQVIDTSVAWATTASLCAPTMPPPACDAGVCVPQSTGSAPICILREGEHTCPPGPYAATAIFYSGARDDRACAPCTCGTPEDPECAGLLSALELHGSGDCSGAIVDALTIGSCGPSSTSARYVPEDLGACPMLTDTEPVGDATPVAPVTLCCTD